MSYIFQIPVLSKFTGDLLQMFGAMGKIFRGSMEVFKESAKKSGEPMMERVGSTMGKIMGGQFGILKSMMKCWNI